MANNFKTTIELSVQSPSGNLLYTTLELPATRGEITDAAHRLRNLPVSEIVITGSDALPELADTRLDAPTVDELNFFASRVNALPDDKLAALGDVFLHRANLGAFEDGLTMKDLINMTYGLDEVMIAPNVANDEQLGQFVIDNEMNDDIAALSDEIIGLLDRERVGRRQRENEGGEFMNGSRGGNVLTNTNASGQPIGLSCDTFCLFAVRNRNISVCLNINIYNVFLH